jgi:hypothetical protein
MDYDRKFDNLQPGTIVTASYTEGRSVFKGVISSINREHPNKPPYFVKLDKGHPEKSLWFFPWEIISAEVRDPALRLEIRRPRTPFELELVRRAGRECAGVNKYGHPVDRNGEDINVDLNGLDDFANVPPERAPRQGGRALRKKIVPPPRPGFINVDDWDQAPPILRDAFQNAALIEYEPRLDPPDDDVEAVEEVQGEREEPEEDEDYDPR